MPDQPVWPDHDFPRLIALVAAYVRRRVTDGAADDIVGTVFGNSARDLLVAERRTGAWRR